MSTRSLIFLKLQKVQSKKSLKQNVNLFPMDNKLCDDAEKKDTPSFEIEPNSNWLEIYHHWDGYPSGVGRTLFEKFNDYDSILNLLLGGDASTINGEVRQYHTWRGEDWDSVKPRQHEKFNVNYKRTWAEWIYKFENGQWLLKKVPHENERTEWLKLADVLKRIDDGEDFD